MAGFHRVYLIGTPGGFLGSDGINAIDVQILNGGGNREWYEARWPEGNPRRLGQIEVVIPADPREPLRNLLDACIAFYPQAFRGCPSMQAVADELATARRLDFDLERTAIPQAWDTLRQEAVEPFKHLYIEEALLRPVELEGFVLNA